MTTGSKWRIEGFHGVGWIVSGRVGERGSRIGLPAGARVVAPEMAAAQVDAWFPDGWLGGDHPTLAAIAASLGELPPGTSPEGAARLKTLVRRALRDGRLTAIQTSLPAVQGGPGVDEEEERRPAAVSQVHTLDFLFEYPDGSPVGDESYVLVDPRGQRTPGKLGKDGLISKQHVDPGTWTVILKEAERVAWETARARRGDEVKITGRTSGFPDGASARVRVFREFAETDRDVVATIQATVENDKVEAVFKYDPSGDAQKREQGVARFVAELSLEDGKHWTKTSRALEVELSTIARVGWESAVVPDGESAALAIETLGFPAGTPIRVELWEHAASGSDQKLADVEGVVVARPRAAATIPVTFSEGSGDSALRGAPRFERWGEYYALVKIEQDGEVVRAARSDLLWCTHRPAA